MAKAAAIYVRISDDRTGEAGGVGRQEEDCRALAKKKKWPVIRLYSDNDISASSYSHRARPAYERLLEDMRARGVDAVITWHEDRLHRQPRELEQFIDVANASGVQLATVTGEIDLGTPEGRLRARMLGNVGAYESEHKAVRIRRKHQEIAAQGRLSGGGDRPFGYESDRVTIRASEALLVREAAKRVLAGDSIRSIATDWNRRKIRTTASGDWYTSAITRLLMSARIAGWRETHRRIVAKAVWPGIISRAQSDKLRELLSDPLRRLNRGARRYLLTGFAFCALCGRRLVARPRADKRRSYVCASGVNFNGCGKIRILAEPFEELVAQEVIHALDSKAFTAALERAAGALPVGNDTNTLQMKLRELADDFANDRIGRQEWIVARDVIEKRLEAASGHLAIERRGAALRPFLRDPKALSKQWPTIDIDRQRTIVSAVIEKVNVGSAVRGRNFFTPERVEVIWRA
jgi:DNA invertase Pin-like site-specific DNA recombinase